MFYEKSLAIERRLGELVRLISTGHHSTPVLAERLGVSVPTISRDIKALRQRGYQIRSVRLAHHWAYELELVSEAAAVSQA
jgi:biotin operon repressor